MKLLIIEEVSALLKMTPQTLRNKLSRGDNVPPSFKLVGCRRRYWRQEDVIRWLEEVAGAECESGSTEVSRGRPRKATQVENRKRGVAK